MGDFFRQHNAVVSLTEQRGCIFADSSVTAAIIASGGPQICPLVERIASYFIGWGMLHRASELNIMFKQGLYLVIPNIDKALAPKVELFRSYLRKLADHDRNAST